MAQYNFDIDVPEDFARQYPTIRLLLLQPQLVEIFSKFDREAQRRKAQLLILGVLSLSLGLVSMFGIVLELLMPSLAKHLAPGHIIAIECTALVAVTIAIVNRFMRNRSLYRIACFRRERIRQWRFQLFLDGEFVQRMSKDQVQGKKELESRLQTMVASLDAREGSLDDFLQNPASEIELLHRVTPYSDKRVADEVVRALMTLRLEHQAQYARRRLSKDTSDRLFALEEHYHWAETLARLSLIGALLIPSAQLVIAFIEQCVGALQFHAWHSLLSAVSLCLVAISATARAYRSGLTVPEEMESYQEYLSHVDMLRAMYTNADVAMRCELLKQMELESERELRRFLILKGKSTFLV